jgi:hypothetical protein
MDTIYAKREQPGNFAMQLPDQATDCTILPTLPAVLRETGEFVLQRV